MWPEKSRGHKRHDECLNHPFMYDCCIYWSNNSINTGAVINDEIKKFFSVENFLRISFTHISLNYDSTCNVGLTCEQPFQHDVLFNLPSPHHRHLPLSPFFFLPLYLSSFSIHPWAVCMVRTVGTAADWASNPDEADSSCIDWAPGFLLLHSKKLCIWTD